MMANIREEGKLNMGRTFSPVALVCAPELVAYPEALTQMELWCREVIEHRGRERVWFLEHPSLYTAGTSAKDGENLGQYPFPIYPTGRGGQMTYHGPGQRVAYLILDLRKRGQDLRQYIWLLEEWLIVALGAFGVEGGRREGRVGIWVVDPVRGESKIAAIGVRVQRWVTLHGIALNVHPQLAHFGGIVPCGLTNFGVTSLHALGKTVSMSEVDQALGQAFEAVFGSSLSQS